jgi:osmotically-inducible protein OsmY
MKSDAEIREDVISELRWDPQVPDPDAIGVAVKDGAVTVTGHVPVYAGKRAADRAAARVYGVRAVADEIQVRLQGEPRDDSDIARAIAHVMEWNTQIPAGAVRARVESGWVRLDGQAGFDYQRREVERMVRHVRGVVAVTNDIKVTPPVSIDRVEAEIEGAFLRAAQFDARHIRVEVSDHTAELHGHVHSLAEAQAAATAAAAAPGVARVDSHLVVSP